MVNAKLYRSPAILAHSGLAHSGAAVQTGALTTTQFIQLYDEFFGRVFNYTRCRCGDADLADDLTAVTFERALANLESFDPLRGPFGPWLFTIARNVANNYLRDEQKRKYLSLEACGEQSGAGGTPEDCFIDGETQAELMKALFYLSEREQDLLSLKFAAELTNRRIAEITGLTEANVGVILYRAVHRLRQILLERQAQHG